MKKKKVVKNKKKAIDNSRVGSWITTSYLQLCLSKLFPSEKFKALEVGIGSGHLGAALRNQFQNNISLTGVEIWPKDIKVRGYYNKIFNGSIQDFLKSNESNFNIILATDILQYLDKQEAKNILTQLRFMTKKGVIVTIPLDEKVKKVKEGHNKGAIVKSEWSLDDFTEYEDKQTWKVSPYCFFLLSPLEEVLF
jgi:ubiquinone/menaquinone biosynthesis C-methylase UbiE